MTWIQFIGLLIGNVLGFGLLSWGLVKLADKFELEDFIDFGRGEDWRNRK